MILEQQISIEWFGSRDTEDERKGSWKSSFDC